MNRSALYRAAAVFAAVMFAAWMPLRAEHASVLQRVVHQYDFEERKLGNFESMPMHWFRITGSGFPHYTTIGFDRSVAHSDETSLKLQLNGGSAGVVLEAGVLPAVPSARYRVTAQVRTEKLEHSRARLTAVFINQYSKVLDQTYRMTDPVRSEGQWTPISVQLPDAPSEAAWIVLRLELLQAEQYETARQSEHRVLEQDIDAAAWFDDVTVYQLPLIALDSQSPLNVVRRPDRPTLHAKVHDVTGAKLRARLRIFDQAGRMVAEQKRPFDRNHPGEWTWQPNLPALGWYHAQLHVLSGDDIVGRTSLDLSWLAALTVRGHSEADRFVVIAEDLPEPQRPLIPDLMKRIGPQQILLSLWRPDMTHAELVNSMDTADPLVMNLLRQNQPIILGVSQLPRDLALSVQTDVDRPLALFADEPDTWQPYIQAMLTRYGHQISDWQVGPTGSVEGYDRPDLPELLPRIESYFRRYVPKTNLLLPWRASHALGSAGDVASKIMMHLPVSIQPEHLDQYVETWPVQPDRMIYHLATLDAATFSHGDRATDLALRMIHAWRYQPDALALDHPWTAAGRDQIDIAPDPLLAVWTTVAEQLAGRRFVGEMDLGEGIRCYLLDGPTGGVLVAWNRSSPTAAAELDLFLGKDPRAVDIYGNARPLKRQDNKQKLTLTQTPVFIEGVDMRLARFRAGFRIVPDLAPSVHTVHEHSLTIENPWPQTITGHVRITGPEKWDFTPRTSDFAIPAGQTLRLPMSITFPIHELAGEKLITAHVELDADQRHQLDLAAPLRIGLEKIDFKSNLSTRSNPDGSTDLVLTLVITNLGEDDESFYAFALPPGLPRMQRIVSPLEAGQTLIKHFYIPADKADDLSGESIRVGLRQTDGPAILNHILDVP